MDPALLTVIPPPSSAPYQGIEFVARPHQQAARDAIKAARQAGRPGFLLGDLTGLGKTLSAWLAIAAMAEQDVLIICPKGAIPQWRRTIARSGTGTLLSGLAYLAMRPALPDRTTMRIHAWRALFVAGMAITFFWALARLPMAEAIALANSTAYGLSGIVFTSSQERAERVGRGVRAGTIWTNCFLIRDLTAPFGGCGISGIGREGGVHSLEFYTELRNVMIKY